MPARGESKVIQFSEAEARRLIRFYEQAEREILDRLNRALLRANKTEYLAGMKKNIEAILQQLREGNRTWCSEAIPRVYSQGLYGADAMLKDAGVAVKAGFGAIHQQAAQVLSENTFQSLDYVAQVIGRRTEGIHRDLALENIRGSVVGYDTWKQVADRYREQLAEQGVTGFRDAAGRNWNMRSYAQMVARTSTMEAHLQGTANRLMEQDHDLVKVSSHSGACPLCVPWQGKILSITGKTPGYPTLAEAKEAGLFHPNCRHAYGLYIDLDKEIKEIEEPGVIEAPEENLEAILKKKGFKEEQAKEIANDLERLPAKEKKKWTEAFKKTTYEIVPDNKGTHYSPTADKVVIGKNEEKSNIIHETAHAMDAGSIKKIIKIGDERYSWNLEVDSASGYLQELISGEAFTRDLENFASKIGAKIEDGWFAEESIEVFKKYNRWAKETIKGLGAEGFDDVSDILSGITQDYNGASMIYGGHSKEYWQRPIMGKKAYNVNVESWADFCTLKVTNNKKMLSLLNEVVPERYNALEKVYQEVFE